MASVNYSAKALTVDDIEKAIKELQDLKKSKEREAREAQEKLPSDARRKVLIGVAVLEAQKRGFITEDFLQEVLDKFLTKNKDRAVFDLASRETEGDKQRGRPKKEKTADTQASQESVVEPTPEHSPEPIPVVTKTEDKEVAATVATTDNKPAAKRVATAQRKTSKSSKKQDEWDLK